MTRLSIITLAIGALVATTGPSATEEGGGRSFTSSFNGRDWLLSCEPIGKKSAAAVVDVISCVAYAHGLAEGLALVRGVHPDAVPVCVPDGVDPSQLRDVAKRYLAQHPERRHEPAAVVLTAAFYDAWPCSRH